MSLRCEFCDHVESELSCNYDHEGVKRELSSSDYLRNLTQRLRRGLSARVTVGDISRLEEIARDIEPTEDEHGRVRSLTDRYS